MRGVESRQAASPSRSTKGLLGGRCLGHAELPDARSIAEGKPTSSPARMQVETINGELKYAFWKKFAEGQWTSTQELTRVHLLVRWLNSLKHLPVSLMERDLESWKRSYTAYLRRCGMYRMGITHRMDSSQQPRVTPRDSAYISTLRQAYLVLSDAYDDRPEQEKDIWDLRRVSMLHNPTLSPGPLNFLKIRQPGSVSRQSHILHTVSRSMRRERVEHGCNLWSASRSSSLPPSLKPRPVRSRVRCCCAI